MRVFILSILLSGVCCSAFAETITLRDGSVIKGSVLGSDDKIMEVVTVDGTVTLNRSEISSVEADKYFIKTKDGSLVNGSIKDMDERRIKIETSGGEMTIMRDNIVFISNTPEAPAPVVKPEEKAVPVQSPAPSVASPAVPVAAGAAVAAVSVSAEPVAEKTASVFKSTQNVAVSSPTTTYEPVVMHEAIISTSGFKPMILAAPAGAGAAGLAAGAGASSAASPVMVSALSAAPSGATLNSSSALRTGSSVSSAPVASKNPTPSAVQAAIKKHNAAPVSQPVPMRMREEQKEQPVADSVKDEPEKNTSESSSSDSGEKKGLGNVFSIGIGLWKPSMKLHLDDVGNGVDVNMNSLSVLFGVRYLWLLENNHRLGFEGGLMSVPSDSATASDGTTVKTSGEVILLQGIYCYYPKNKKLPYLLGGLGLGFSRVSYKTELGGEQTSSKTLSSSQPVITIGAGMEKDLKDTTIGWEARLTRMSIGSGSLSGSSSLFFSLLGRLSWKTK